MTEDELIKHIIRVALKDNPTSMNQDLRINLKTKKFLKGVNNLSDISDDYLHYELNTLQNTQPWIHDLKPKHQDEIEGITSLIFKLKLDYMPELINYSNFIPDPVLEFKNEWLRLIHNRHDIQCLKYKNFNAEHWGSSPKEALDNILKAASLLAKEKLSQQQLSALLTNKSKELTDKDIFDLISVHPQLSLNIRPRKVILNFYARNIPKQCLIVENMDTYHYLQDKLPVDWMLVYGFGNRVTKSDVSNLDIVDLHASREVSDHIKQACYDLWSDIQGDKLYWGDLDDKGNQIFESLKNQYPALRKWQPAYDAMEKRKHLSMATFTDVHQESILIRDLGLAD